jgi:hypothetical protein
VLALFLVTIWLVAGLLVLLGLSLGLIEWGERPGARA